METDESECRLTSQWVPGYKLMHKLVTVVLTTPRLDICQQYIAVYILCVANIFVVCSNLPPTPE